MKNAASSQDWGTIWELMTPDRRKQLEGSLKGEEDEVAAMLEMSADDVKSMSVKDVFVAVKEKQMEGNEEDMEKAAEAEFVKEEIDGDNAKVTFKSEGRERTLDMIKVDGKWYIDETFIR
jgi:hypothetical protein